MDKTIKETCDVAAPKIDPKKSKRQTYWWTKNIARLRRKCINARRAWQRAKRKRRLVEEQIQTLGDAYKVCRKDLRIEINKAISSAWQELINMINEDPWGLPYKIILKKLKMASIALTECLESGILAELLDNLFPRNNRIDIIPDWSNFEWNDDWLISCEKIFRVFKKRTVALYKAPGPDGKTVVWKQTTIEILEIDIRNSKAHFF